MTLFSVPINNVAGHSMGFIGFLNPGPPPQRPVGVQIYTGRVHDHGSAGRIHNLSR